MKDIMRRMQKENCCGCSACYSVCPTGAINMQEDEEGFLYPYVDAEKCISCGKCDSVCAMSVSGEKEKQQDEYCAYAVKAMDEEVLVNSSSGGVFSLLAQQVLENNGYVCAAAMRDDNMGVEHIIISEKEELVKLQKSKYIQSDLRSCFGEIERLLKENKEVMFVGCPCQVAGLKKFLKCSYDKLLVVDVICHGVPSPKAWKCYVNSKKEKREVEKVEFRNKAIEIGSCVSMLFSDGSVLKEQGNKSQWIIGFLKDIINRSSCANCPFPYENRQGDMTIGDLWGVEWIYPQFDDKKGTSLILLNSDKGYEKFETIKSKTECAELDYLRIRHVNKALYKHFLSHPGRKYFFEMLNKGKTFEESIEVALNTKYDVGIVGWWYNLNYGATLTSYALYKAVEEIGYKALMIEAPATFRPDDIQIRDPFEKGRRFIERYCNVSERYYLASENSQLNNVCENFLVGSDQLWKGYRGKYRWSGGFYMLDFVDDDKKKIAYATSFGVNKFEGDELDVATTQKLLGRFDAISVREKTGVDICDTLGVEAVLMPDPVFICDKKTYLDVMTSCSLMDKPFVLAYILNPTEYKQNLLIELSRNLDRPLVVIADKNPEYINYPNVKPWKMDVKDNVDMGDWLWYMKNADYVVTDSYHGMCFSVIFEKKFLGLNPRDGIDRFLTLAEKICISDRVNYCKNAEKACEILQTELDYEAINRVLDKERKIALEWIKDAIEMPKTDREKMDISSEKYRIDTLISFTYRELQKKVKKLKDDNTKSIQNIWKWLSNKDKSDREEKRATRAEIKATRAEMIVNRKLLLRLFLQQELCGKCIAIKGAGTHTKELLQILPENVEVKCIVVNEIDNKYEFGCPLITMNKLSNYDVDVVVISSFRYKEEMKKDVMDLNKSYEIFDLYEKLEKMGIKLTKEFYY